MLSTKKRFLIVLLTVLGALIAVGAIVILRVLDINERSPLFFGELTIGTPNIATYYYNNGTDSGILSLNVLEIKSNYSTASISFAGDSEIFNTSLIGTYINSTGGQQDWARYTFFAVPIAELGAAGSELYFILRPTLQVSYNITDPSGILGPKNANYTYIIQGVSNYWADFDQPFIHGAQASLLISIIDENGTHVAKGIIDLTCGMLWELEISSGGSLGTLRIRDTNYAISRNRFAALPTSIIVAIVGPIVIFFVTWKVPSFKLPKEEQTEFLALLAVGGAVILLDIMVDVWLYAPLTYPGILALHVILTGVLALICIWKKYGLKWITPALLELGFVTVINFAVKEPLYPAMCAAMGLLASWLCIVYASGYKRIKSTTKKGKFVSEFI